MSNFLIAYGGTGQHAALSYIRLCFLCKDILAPLDLQGQNHLPFMYVFDKDIGDRQGGKKSAGTLLFDLTKKLANNSEVKAVDPIPTVTPEVGIQTLKDLLKNASEISELLFSKEQLGVNVVHGNFGQPAVGATGLYLKLNDTIKENNKSVNKDAAFADLNARIENSTGQKIAHVGSAIGGTGSGVMPAAVSWFSKLNIDNHHLSIPILEWFRLTDTGTNNHKATARNNLIRQNRSGGLHFYLHDLQQMSAVLPLGYDANRLGSEACVREWEGDYNQASKESAINFAAALSIWEFFSPNKILQKGMYSFVTDEQNKISESSKIEDYTLVSLIKANIHLLAEIECVCDFLCNPPDTKHILFNLYDNYKIPILEQCPKKVWPELAQSLKALIANKYESIKWLQDLDFVDKQLSEARETIYLQGVQQFKDLFPTSVSTNSNLTETIYTHLTNRAKALLRKFGKDSNDLTKLSPIRMLPDYVREGVRPAPAPIGTLAPISDPNNIRSLYSIDEILPMSIPSPLSTMHMLKIEIDHRINAIENPTNFTNVSEIDGLTRAATEERKWLFTKYLLLFKGLVAGEIFIKRSLLWDNLQNRSDQKSIGWVIGHIGGAEDQGYAELEEPSINLLFFRSKIRQTEVLVGATTPNLFLFPSISVGDEIWNELDNKLQFIGDDVKTALSRWCELIKQRDGIQDFNRPGWFRVLWREFDEYKSNILNREEDVIKERFPAVWNKVIKQFPMTKLKMGV